MAETLAGDQAADKGATKNQAPPSDANPYLAGEVIGERYRLVRELGRGGMGVVWVAHSLVLGVDVAIKLIHASAAGALATRIVREAHAAARLGHPALVRVFDLGWTQRGDPFLVMELVQGETLSALLAREQRLPAIRAVQMLLPIADGLRLAHERGIVHRDLKPDNILVATDALGRTQPKLLDFGIAKVDQQPLDSKLTQFGTVVGSPEYMSPEQALGLDDIDARTDVWSLCVVLYEIICGALPFHRNNYNALMHAIINAKPTPTTEVGAGDADLWSVIERGLSKAAEQRWASMTELGEALALWLYQHGVREDLCGNSLRAVWLDGTLSGVRMDVSPSIPVARPLAEAVSGVAPKPRADTGPGRAPNAEAAAHAGGATAERARSRRRLRLRGGVAAGAAALVGLLALAVGRAGSPSEDEAKSGSDIAAHTPKAPSAPPAPEPPRAEEAAGATPSAAPVGSSPPPGPAADAGSEQKAGEAASGTPASSAAPKVKAPAKARTAPKRATRRKHDFGF